MTYFGRKSRGCLTRAPLGAALAAPWLVSVPGCLVTIADPAPVQATGGRAGTTPTSGGRVGQGAGGDANGGNTNGTAGGAGARDGGCPGGRKTCGGVCVDETDAAFGCGPETCTPCAPPHVSARCEAGACVVGECEADWVDCDANAANGCEVAFGNPLPAARMIEATRFTPTGAADLGEWSALPRGALGERCTTCRPDQPGEQPGEPILNAPHDARNLRGQFRVAWDDLALYVFTQVEDNQIVALDRNLPERQDGLELFLDGVTQGSSEYGPDSHHLFVGALGQNVDRKNPSDVGPGTHVNVKSRIEAACYFVEIRVDWFYVTGLLQPETPAPGKTYGFTLAVNDWDASGSGDAGTPPERQNQLFWAQPGFKYSYDTSQFATLTLR